MLVRDVLKVMAYNDFVEFITIPAEDGSKHNWFVVGNVPEEYLDLVVTGINDVGKCKNTCHLPLLPDPEWFSCIGIRAASKEEVEKLISAGFLDEDFI